MAVTGLSSLLIHVPISRSATSRPVQTYLPLPTKFHSLQLVRFSQSGKNLPEQPLENQNPANGNGIQGDRVGGENRLPLLNVNWRELLLDPDPDNILAIGLTGLLTWASVQVLWQLFLIALAIVAAAVKYSLVAFFLIFILVTLL